MTQSEHFTITITDQSQLTMNDVLHIVSFDEDGVSIMTKQGKVIVEGTKLKVESLSKETETILISGEILELSFPKTKQSMKTVMMKKRT